MPLKVMVVLGTRPEIIKLAPVVQEFERKGHEVILVHTEQHYDDNMSKIFFEDLELRLPDYFLGKSTGTHGKQTAKMLVGVEELLMSEKPDWVVVQGDTNTSFAGALAAVKLGIPVAHIEAGLRSHDVRMPEEYNRIMIDHISRLNFAPTYDIAGRLVEEQVMALNYVVGNTVIDVIERIAPTVERPEKLNYLGINKYALMTYHRVENLTEAGHLRKVIMALGELPIDIIFPAHPRTMDLLLEMRIIIPSNMHIMGPVGYKEFIGYMKYCEYVITDSGGIQEEVTAPSMQKKVYVLRKSTERREAANTGHAFLLFKTPDTYVRLILEDQEEEDYFRGCPYGNGHAAKKIVEIMETSKGWT